MWRLIFPLLAAALFAAHLLFHGAGWPASAGFLAAAAALMLAPRGWARRLSAALCCLMAAEWLRAAWALSAARIAAGLPWLRAGCIVAACALFTLAAAAVFASPAARRRCRRGDRRGAGPSGV
ncbi:MAG: hypothetical protein HUK26_05010 [Duodenibacillus sp.]|nr:hypothetical protein [Duodenibacillus sp.]